MVLLFSIVRVNFNSVILFTKLKSVFLKKKTSASEFTRTVHMKSLIFFSKKLVQLSDFTRIIHVIVNNFFLLFLKISLR